MRLLFRCGESFLMLIWIIHVAFSITDGENVTGGKILLGAKYFFLPVSVFFIAVDFSIETGQIVA